MIINAYCEMVEVAVFSAEVVVLISLVGGVDVATMDGVKLAAVVSVVVAVPFIVVEAVEASDGAVVLACPVPSEPSGEVWFGAVSVLFKFVCGLVLGTWVLTEHSPAATASAPPESVTHDGSPVSLS